MRAIRYHEHGDPDVLRVEDVEKPTPSEGEIRVELKAAGVNPVDTYFRDGSYQPFTLPMVPGVDFAGVVDEVGTGVEGFDVGDRVFGTGLGNDRYGSTAEYVIAPTDRIAHLSDGVSFVEAGAAGVATVTAWRAIVDHAALEPAEYCLVHGGSGGVGHAAVQIAAASGARVVTTASERYHDALSELGARTVLDYERDDLQSAVAEATDGGPNVVVDHMLERYLQFDCDVAAPYARIVLFRNRHLEAGFTNVPAAGGKELQFHLMSMYNAPRLADPLARVDRLLADGLLRVEVAGEYGFDEVAEAHRRVREESFLGKLVVVP
ncbi:NADPH:quinone reductase [Haloprofundus halophilus]|uniref:NADPH:quinone reductase n=1 Tax=Haloprofundus halophilus TaxID=2283527 RepID=UPI000E42E4A8|nr:NADPH:quinone reductase [Haloprofundus halophilus]